MVFRPLLLPTGFVFRVAARFAAQILVAIPGHAFAGFGTMRAFVRREIGIMLRRAAKQCLTKASKP